MNMPRYSEADLREFQRCFGGHARESLQGLVAMQSRVRPGDEPKTLIGLSGLGEYRAKRIGLWEREK